MPAVHPLTHVHRHIVTATVDEVVISGIRPSFTANLHVDGCVVWVGKSSMQIQMRAWQHNPDVPWLQANFTFVCRNLETNKSMCVLFF